MLILEFNNIRILLFHYGAILKKEGKATQKREGKAILVFAYIQILVVPNILIKPSINIYEIQDCFLFIFVIVILCAI